LRAAFAAVRAVCFPYVAFLWTLISFVLAILALPFAPKSARAAHAVARVWAKGYIACFGGGLRVEHAERLDPNSIRMLVANHASYLDPPAIIAAFPGQVRFVLKRELLAVPFVGWYARLAGHFLLDRSNPREGKRVLERAVRRAQAHRLNPMVFPEGTRTHDGRLAPLKSGAFQLAIAAGIDVQPIAVLDTYEMLPRGAAAPRRSGTIRLRVGEPIPVAGLEGSAGRRAIAERVREALHALGVE
jgi:1-acyl-sn-glycerol-3-phosphate acyltransferase